MHNTSLAWRNDLASRDYSVPVQEFSTGHYVIRYGTSPSQPPAASADQASSPAFSDRYATVKQLAGECAGLFTQGALRNLIWNAEAYARNPKPDAQSNGFLPVIYRPGGKRKVLLDRVAFEQWLRGEPNNQVHHGR